MENLLCEQSDHCLILDFINKLCKKYNTTTFDAFKKELLNNKKMYNFIVKEHDNLCLIYSENSNHHSTFNSLTFELENDTRCCIIDKNTFEPIVSMYNCTYCNDDALELLKKINWENISVTQCYEGIYVLVYFYNNKWNVSSRTELDINNLQSNKLHNKTYRDLFDELIAPLFKLDDLDKNYCYHFIMVHYKIKNIVGYHFEKDYKKLIHVLTTESKTLKPIDYIINSSVIQPEKMYFSCLDEMISKIEQISSTDLYTKNISIEGFMIKYIRGNKITMMKIQTNAYKKIFNVRNHCSDNVHQFYV